MATANAWPMVLHLGPLGRSVTDDEFFQFCQLNRELHIERTSEGEIVVMPPSGGESGRRELRIGAALHQWAEADGTGVPFGSSTGFVLPNGAERSPDAAWVKRERWDALTPEERERFPPLCPDFVVEIRSRTDRIPVLQEKMREYIANGADLGWLIDPAKRRVYIYRPGAAVVRLDNPESVSGDPRLAGFSLDLRRIFT
ncbi:MAG: Uma2 family endonuclease [Pirellulales bacterium]|nr:Uma2 family endonuclease [Pirellulales bacterium]